jgi:hypothetical protein
MVRKAKELANPKPGKMLKMILRSLFLNFMMMIMKLADVCRGKEMLHL